MDRRDIFKTAALIRERWLPERYTINSTDTVKLLDIIRTKDLDECLEVISVCMRYGYVMGHRATLNGTYKETRNRSTEICKTEEPMQKSAQG